MTITSIGMPKDMLKSRDYFGKKLTKPALQKAVEFWHDKFMPTHFRPGAANKYKYRPRKTKTIIRKNRLAAKGLPEARLPLIWSGATKRQISRMIRVTGTAKTASGRMSGPRYIHMYSKGGDRPYLAGEITAVTKKEANELAKLIENEMTQKIQTDTTRTVERV